MSPDARRAPVERYDLRRVHPALRFGTASDRYAGWMDKVYPRDVWADRVTSRSKKAGGASVEERMLPIESVEDYFLHFGVLELDFPFYRPLLEPDGKPSTNLHTLIRYAEAAPANARFLLKAPQAYTARLLPRKSGGRLAFEENPDYLDAPQFTERFVLPAHKALGPRLAGVIVEQEYTKVRESPPPEAFLNGLARFFDDVPNDVAYHLEVRSAHLLVPGYFELLRAHGLGFCFSHWTWLPPLTDQWHLAGGLLPAHDEVVVRLMNPREMRHDEALRLAAPFDAPVPALSETAEARRMVDEVVALGVKAAEAGVTLNVIASNRAWGCAPDLARTVAGRFLDVAERRGL
jgi:uncharacterized protein YecE (DUF72 family)